MLLLLGGPSAPPLTKTQRECVDFTPVAGMKPRVTVRLVAPISAAFLA
jgi:hypothetical protein